MFVHSFVQAVACEAEVELDKWHLSRAFLQKLPSIRHCPHGDAVRAPRLVGDMGALVEELLCLAWCPRHRLYARLTLTGRLGISS